MIRIVLLGAIACLVIGAAVVLWPSGEDHPDRSSATLACAALRRAEPVDAHDATDAHLIGAAEQFSRAAAVEDKSRQPLADALELVANLVFYEGRPADDPELRAAVAAAGKQCGPAGDAQESLAQQACAATPTTIATGDVAARHRLIGASELASAAVLADPRFRPLTSALRDAAGEHGLAMTPAQAKPWLDAVHARCRELELEA